MLSFFLICSSLKIYIKKTIHTIPNANNKDLEYIRFEINVCIVDILYISSYIKIVLFIEQNPPFGRILLTEASKKLKIKRFVESLLEALERAED